MVRLGREQVEIGENSLWEWTGQDDGSGGNAVQGGVRVSKVAAKSQAVAENPSVDQPVRLYQNAPWMLVFPAVFLAVTLFCFNYLGDGLRDALDPRDRSGR